VAGHQGLEVLIGVAVALLLTWLLLIAALGVRRHRTRQLEAAYRRFSPSGVQPGGNRRLGLGLLVLSVLVILNVAWLGLLLSQTPGERAVDTTPTQIATPGGVTSDTRPSRGSGARSGSTAGAISLQNPPDSARPFQPVRIQGTYRAGADTLLRVQVWEGGKWLAFPIPTKTDKSGRFTAHVELGQPGRYTLRVLDPESGVTSEPFVLVIRG
jgi:hypothetical protein